jgi:hypothetical protein
MKQLSIGHRCDFCGQEIVYVVPDSPAEAFGALFQERTFLELRSAQIRDPSQVVAEQWYCSDYCAREALDLRINRKEKQMRQNPEAIRSVSSFFRGLNILGITDRIPGNAHVNAGRPKSR